VRATVQGSRSYPYEVEVRFRPLSRAQWLRVAAALAERFITLARLLAGELPEDMEEIFAGAKLSLFPHRLRDLETDCSCPDWSNPCKHTAAVFYLLAEEFDRDPFLLFKLRGLDREELFELLGYSGAAAPALPEPDRVEAAEPVPEEPPSDPAVFWGGEEPPGDLFGEVRVPEVAAALPKRLGGFPFWRGKTPILEALEPFYLKAAPLGLDVFSGLIQAPAAEAPAPVKPVETPPRKAKVIPITSRQGKRPSKKAVLKKKPRKNRRVKTGRPSRLRSGQGPEYPFSEEFGIGGRGLDWEPG
jgi:uncharacterized Zn finger protein